jgi:ferredoxin
MDDTIGGGDRAQAMPDTELEVVIDEGICLGSQNCVMEAADIFQLDEAGISRVRREVHPSEFSLLQRIVDMCPSGALRIRRVREAARNEPPSG